MQALLEMFFGVGMIAGPSVGGVLFEHGGFCCPFFVMGLATLIATVFVCFALPKSSEFR